MTSPHEKMEQTYVCRPNETQDQEPLHFQIVDTYDETLPSMNHIFLQRLEHGKLLCKIKGPPYARILSKSMHIELKERIPSIGTGDPSSSIESLPNANVIEEAFPHFDFYYNSCSLCANIELEKRTGNCLMHSEKKKITHRNGNSHIKHRIHRVAPIKIPPEIFKNQLKDTSDIISPIKLLPNTKQLLEVSLWQFDKSLITPLHSCSSIHLTLFQRSCISNKEENEIDTTELNLMPLGYKPNIDLSKIKRITRKRKNPHLYVADSNVKAKPQETQMNTESIIPIACNDGSAGYVQALFDPDDNQNKCLFLESDIKDNEEIIVIQGRDETANIETYTQKNIDVLLAAAAKNNSNSLIICQQTADEHQTSTVIGVPSASVIEAQRIIFFHDGHLC